MTIQEALNQGISKYPMHPFSLHDEYYNSFLHAGTDIFADDKLLSTQKKIRDFLTKIQLNNECLLPKYYQGISEIMLWIQFKKLPLPFCVNKRINPNNDSDIDIQVQDGDYIFNFEVKCPILDKHASESQLELVQLFRTTSKEVSEAGVDTFVREMIAPILVKKEAGFSGVTQKKINDNKLVDYLKSAQMKFIPPDEKMCNVLFLSLPIREIEHYYAYLENGISGIFTGSTPELIFKDEKKPSFSNIDVVILSSLLENHLYYTNPDAWDLSKSFNLMLINPANAATKRKDIFRRLLEIIPNDTQRFEEYFEKFSKTVHIEEMKTGIPGLGESLMILLFPHYFDEYYHNQWSRYTSDET